MRDYINEVNTIVSITNFVEETLFEKCLKAESACENTDEHDEVLFHYKLALFMEDVQYKIEELEWEFPKVRNLVHEYYARQKLRDQILTAAKTNQGTFVAEDIRAFRDCMGGTEDFGIWQAKLAEEMENTNGADYRYETDEVIEMLGDYDNFKA